METSVSGERARCRQAGPQNRASDRRAVKSRAQNPHIHRRRWTGRRVAFHRCLRARLTARSQIGERQ